MNRMNGFGIARKNNGDWCVSIVFVEMFLLFCEGSVVEIFREARVGRRPIL